MVNAYLMNALMITLFVVIGIIVIRIIVKTIHELIYRRDYKLEEKRRERKATDDRYEDVCKYIRSVQEEVWKIEERIKEMEDKKNVKKKKRD